MRSRSIETLILAGIAAFTPSCSWPLKMPWSKPTPDEIFAKTLRPEKSTKSSKELSDQELLDLAKQIGEALNDLNYEQISILVDQYQAGGGERLGDLSGVGERAKQVNESKLHVDYEGATFDVSGTGLVYSRKTDVPNLTLEVAVSDTATLAEFSLFGRDVQGRKLAKDPVDRKEVVKEILRGNYDEAVRAFARPEFEPREMDAKTYLEGLLNQDWKYDGDKKCLVAGETTFTAKKIDDVTVYELSTPGGKSLLSVKISGSEGRVEEKVYDGEGAELLTRVFRTSGNYAAKVRNLLDATWDKNAPAATSRLADGTGGH